MRYLPYPQSCSARTVVEFGNTTVGFGSEPTTIEEMDKFLGETAVQMKKERNTFCTALLNNDQAKLFHDTFEKHGWYCVQRNRYHPKYGKSVSFYLLTLDWGKNRNFIDLPIDGTTPVVECKLSQRY